MTQWNFKACVFHWDLENEEEALSQLGPDFHLFYLGTTYCPRILIPAKDHSHKPYNSTYFGVYYMDKQHYVGLCRA